MLDKLDQVIVFGPNPVPEHNSINVRGEIDQQGGLPVSGRRRNEGQFAMQVLVQGIDQAHTTQNIFATLRGANLSQ
ncbi:MAG: hypothetical protein M1347_08200 [Chloroflexi bacterium]|nr:hypothetical protein [Chloroflexota bacterium]